MIRLLYKHTVKLILALLVSGCASDPVDFPSDSMGRNNSHRGVVSRNKPNSFYSSQPGSGSSSANAYSYSGQYLTGVYANSYALRNFIQQMVHKHGFSESYLNSLFSQAKRLEYVIRLENPPSTYSPTPPRPGSWTRYRNKFLTDQHINNGVEFWYSNADAIKKASATYRVDPEYIVAIIGVETYFGRNIGKTSILDALTTLSFNTYRRSKYFMSELEHYLLMVREEGINPREPVGSWAGAMGLGQFMPSSFRRLAVDFNHDGRRDLWHEHDAIGSVAHYFSRSGWRFNSPVAYPSGFPGDSGVISLSSYHGDEYWRVFPNFKVIKSYNNSSKYAMAVHQLAQAIKQQYLGVAYQERPYSVDQRVAQ